MLWVQGLVREHLAAEPGRERRRNGSPPHTWLTIDYSFDECAEPFVLEITRLRDDFESPAERDLARFQRGLTNLTNQVGSSHWFVGVRPEVRLNPTLQSHVAKMMQFALELGLDRLGSVPDHDLGPELMSRMRPAFWQSCREARLAGVVYVERTTGGGVRFLTVDEISDSRSLGRPLERAMEGKARALGIAKLRGGYWTMLAIDVEREDARTYLRPGVQLPGVPLGIDHVWLLVRDASGEELRDAYYANRENRRLVRVRATAR